MERNGIAGELYNRRPGDKRRGLTFQYKVL